MKKDFKMIIEIIDIDSNDIIKTSNNSLQEENIETADYNETTN